VGGKCSWDGRNVYTYTVLIGKLQGRHHLGNLSTDRSTSQWIFRKIGFEKCVLYSTGYG
jgi:hypothetical protein